MDVFLGSVEAVQFSEPLLSLEDHFSYAGDAAVVPQFGDHVLDLGPLKDAQFLGLLECSGAKFGVHLRDVPAGLGDGDAEFFGDAMEGEAAFAQLPCLLGDLCLNKSLGVMDLNGLDLLDAVLITGFIFTGSLSGHQELQVRT